MSQPITPKGPSALSYFFDSLSGPLTYYQQLVQDYGSFVKLPLRPATYLLTQVEGIHHILQTNADNYTKQTESFTRLQGALGNSTVTLHGPAWSSRRQAFQPLFHKEHFVELTKPIPTLTQQLLDRLDGYAQKRHCFDIALEMMALELSIASRGFFNYAINEESYSITNHIAGGNAYLGKGVICPHLPTPGFFRYQKASILLDKLALKMIKHRMNLETPPSDLFDAILKYCKEHALTEKDMIDEIKSFLITGHETTGLGLGWTWYCLAKNQEIDEALAAHCKQQLGGRSAAYADIETLPLCKQVFEEALRLYPPIWSLWRKSMEADTILGHKIEQDTTIIIPIFALHRDPLLWPDPHVFDPKRFDPKCKHTRARFAYLPFGAGPRICIASLYAMAQAQMIIATIVQHFRFECDPLRVVRPTPQLTLKPRGGIWVKAFRR